MEGADTMDLKVRDDHTTIEDIRVRGRREGGRKGKEGRRRGRKGGGRREGERA